MTTDELISLEVFCTREGVEISFVRALHDRGLIRVTIVEQQDLLEPAMLPHIEKLARMHYDLDINLEGIEAISHLLERMEHLQAEMRSLRDRLKLYEADEP
ncbi:MAG: chaperone modulator CbpM [Flavobacteriales bacterium]